MQQSTYCQLFVVALLRSRSDLDDRLCERAFRSSHSRSQKWTAVICGFRRHHMIRLFFPGVHGLMTGASRLEASARHVLDRLNPEPASSKGELVHACNKQESERPKANSTGWSDPGWCASGCAFEPCDRILLERVFAIAKLEVTEI